MIRLDMSVEEGELALEFDVPDKPGETVRLDDLAVFLLHLEVVRHRVTELASRALSKSEGFDLAIK